MTVSKHELVDALRMRYDAYSAETVFDMACERAGLGDKVSFDGKDLAAFRAALASVGDRVGGVLALIDEMLDGAKSADPAKPEAKPAKKKEGAAESVETTVVLSGLDVADGEQVLMCGAFPTLGDWDPERAQPMARKGDQWLATVKVAPDTNVPFKFLRRCPDGKVIWEAGDDRHLVANQRIEATWRTAPAPTPAP